MPKIVKKTAALATLMIAGTLGTGGAVLYANADAEASAGPVGGSSAGPSKISLQEAMTGLQENRAELSAQQSAERAQAVGTLEMPPGAEFGPPVPFPQLDAQIDARSSSRTTAAEGVEPPTLEWYEDGYFGSLVAIDWQCGWLSTGVRAVGESDDAVASHAVNVLHEFASSEYATSFVDYDVFLSEFVDPVLENDTAMADLWLDQNCDAPTRVD